MSPSEDQLRAALRDGAGDGSGGLNPDVFIAQANEIRHHRWVRYGSALAAAAVVAIGGVLIATLGGTTQTDHSAGQSARLPAAASDQAAGTAAGSNHAAFGNGSSNGSAAPCPVSAPSRATIGSGDGSFFAGSVASFTVCAYPETGGAALTSESGGALTTILSGQDAQQLATSLDGAAKTPSPDPCPLFRTANGKLLVMIPVASDGTAMSPVTALVLQNSCNQPVTNGTEVRYNWTPPAALTPYLQQLAAVSSTGPSVVAPRPVSSSPLEHGSPINS
jgi:hypothetical protein